MQILKYGLEYYAYISRFTNYARSFLLLRLEKLESKIEAVMKVLPKHEDPDINEIGHGTICLAKFTLDDKYVFCFFHLFTHFFHFLFVDISFIFKMIVLYSTLCNRC